jgi:lipid-A-disaccharide synthase-like uncharacterized protein
MGMSVFEMLGVAGIAISMLAYVPQVVHLGREHCSAGVSRRAWAMWLLSSVLIGTLAVYRQDPVFILLQLSTLTSAAIILFLAHKYRGMVCAWHRPLTADSEDSRIGQRDHLAHPKVREHRKLRLLPRQEAPLPRRPGCDPLASRARSVIKTPARGDEPPRARHVPTGVVRE